MIDYIKVKFINDSVKDIDDTHRMGTLIKKHNRLVRLKRASGFEVDSRHTELIELSEGGAIRYSEIYADRIALYVIEPQDGPETVRHTIQEALEVAF